ncbi:MAG: nucleotidyltransferase family protein [Alphaproteobacteria bacterium]|nr:nucleotidyltransferase family protein [Alphaproteobacteria bacterium]
MTIKSAIILAAGLGTRMQADADAPPKPLTKLAGITLLDWMIEKLIAAGVAHIIINMHFKADMIIDHVQSHKYNATILLSDERAGLLDTGGGVVKALDLLAGKLGLLAGELQAAPFFICNADIIWLETGSNLQALAQAFDANDMDACLLLTKREQAGGYKGVGDFNMDAQGHIMRHKGQGDYVYAGVQVAHPRLLANAPQGAFPLNLLWDKALAKTRLYGHGFVGEWMHVGTKEALAVAQAKLAAKAQTLSPPAKNRL